jgi:uncharacterized protein (DUF2267 family)
MPSASKTELLVSRVCRWSSRTSTSACFRETRGRRRDTLVRRARKCSSPCITGTPATAAIRGTLNAVLSQIPPGERDQLVGHFPKDVRALVNARRVIGESSRHWRTELALDVAAAWRGGITVDDAQVLVPAVIGVVRRFVPEEDADVEATLKRRIKDLWDVSVDPNVADPTAPV